MQIDEHKTNNFHSIRLQFSCTCFFLSAFPFWSYCLISIIWFSVCVFLAQFISLQITFFCGAFISLFRHLLRQRGSECLNVFGQFFPFVLILFIFRRKFMLSQTIHIELISYAACVMCVCEKVYANVCRCWHYIIHIHILCMGTEMVASSCLANATLTNFFSFHQSELFVCCHTTLICRKIFEQLEVLLLLLLLWLPLFSLATRA